MEKIRMCFSKEKPSENKVEEGGEKDKFDGLPWGTIDWTEHTDKGIFHTVKISVR